MVYYFFRYNYLFLLLNFSLFFISVPNAHAQNCDSIEIGKGNNLGIYGGLASDLTYTDNGRLFAACAVPASVFITDDTAHTWYMAFPKDSLEYECGQRGWGGGAITILTNRQGWVAAHTLENGGDLSSAVISFSNGDTGSWHTAIDGFLLEQMGYSNLAVNGIALSDYYLYALLKNYIVRINTKGVDTSSIIDVYSQIPTIDSSFTIKSIAIANSPSGYPFYVTLDSASSQTSQGNLYKYDGLSFNKVKLPTGIPYAYQVFTHPNQSTGDTIFINGIHANGKVKLYRSFDGGSTWASISPKTNSPVDGITNVDYSPLWKSQMPSSNGLLFSNGLAYISKDLGTSWIETATIPQSTTNIHCASLAMHPSDTTFYVGNNMPGVYVSNTGLKGPLVQQDGIGLEAVLVWKIAHNSSESIFYLATQSGLAYTTKYNDDSIIGITKWKTPYGKFPIDSTDIHRGVQSVAIDPHDSSHVIAGQANGFFVTHSGPDGFYNVLPTAYANGDNNTRDIAFVTSNIVIAVTGTWKDMYKGNGDIWRSIDGGDSWIKVSPSGFGTGTTIAVGYGKTDTVIYVGSGLHNVENGYLWKSTDLGLNWIQVNQGPTDVNNPAYQALVINDIVVDPRGTDTLYISSGHDTTMAFVKSYDGGITYQYVTSLSQNWTKAIEIDPSNPDSIVYVSINRKLYQYTPVLDSAELIYTGIPGDLIRDLSIGSILAGTTTGFYGISEEKDAGTIVTIFHPAFTKENHVQLYPNPAKDNLSIYIEGEDFPAKVEIFIYDLMGKIITQITINHYKSGDAINLDISSLANGVYYLQLHTNQLVSTEKIIVSKM